MNLVDTHCHINFDSYDADREAVLIRASAAGVKQIIIPAIDVPTSKDILTLATAHSGLYAAVGSHPNSTADWRAADANTIADLAAHEKVVAVGEIGLDYYWDKSPRDVQTAAFEAQLTLAARLELPVIIHNREASDDTISILETWVNSLSPSLREHPGVMHSFSGSPAIAQRALTIGFYLGFTGPITYKNAHETRQIAAQAPLDRILVETDGPFLPPIPYRGKRNEPAYIPHICERLAAVRQISVEEVAETTTRNAERLFRLK